MATLNAIPAPQPAAPAATPSAEPAATPGDSGSFATTLSSAKTPAAAAAQGEAGNATAGAQGATSPRSGSGPRSGTRKSGARGEDAPPGGNALPLLASLPPLIPPAPAVTAAVPPVAPAANATAPCSGVAAATDSPGAANALVDAAAAAAAQSAVPVGVAEESAASTDKATLRTPALATVGTLAAADGEDPGAGQTLPTAPGGALAARADETFMAPVLTARAIAPAAASEATLTADSVNAALSAAMSAGVPTPLAQAASAAAGAPPSAATPAPAQAPVVAQIATPVGSPEWPQQLGERVSVLVNQSLTNASIKLSPPDLGPLEIRIAVSAGQANIAFTTHSQVTREALEAAAPQLRSALGAQGFGSVNVDVSQQQFRDRAPQSSPYESEFSFAAGAKPADAVSGPGRATRYPVGGAQRLDAYA